jgi:hypothetical protein
MQLMERISSIQVPPFKHESGAQSVKSTQNLVLSVPKKHSQVTGKVWSLQVPPFKQGLAEQSKGGTSQLLESPLELENPPLHTQVKSQSPSTQTP